MSVSLDFRLLGFRLAALELELNLTEETPGYPPAQSAHAKLLSPEMDRTVNKTIKWFSRKWTSRMTQ